MDHFFDIYKWFSFDEKMGILNNEVKKDIKHDSEIKNLVNEFKKYKR